MLSERIGTDLSGSFYEVKDGQVVWSGPNFFALVLNSPEKYGLKELGNTGEYYTEFLVDNSKPGIEVLVRGSKGELIKGTVATLRDDKAVVYYRSIDMPRYASLTVVPGTEVYQYVSPQKEITSPSWYNGHEWLAKLPTGTSIKNN